MGRRRTWLVAGTIAAVALVVALALGSWVRTQVLDARAKHSRAGDACPVTASGGIVGLDAATGDVRWSNIVPPNGDLELRAGAIHLVHPDARHPRDRTIDASDGSVDACMRITDLPRDPYSGTHQPDQLRPGATVGGLTIVPWGGGLRATDETGRGVWGTTDMAPTSLLDDRLLVQTARFGNARSRTAALVDLRTGATLWEQPGLIRNEETAPARRLAIVRDAGARRRFRALDVTTGNERWRTTIPTADPGWDPRALEVGDLVIFTPGTNRRWSVPGGVRDAVVSTDGSTVVVAVDAYLADEFD